MFSLDQRPERGPKPEVLILAGCEVAASYLGPILNDPIRHGTLLAGWGRGDGLWDVWGVSWDFRTPRYRSERLEGGDCRRSRGSGVWLSWNRCQL